MKVKEFAQGFSGLMAAGYAELDVDVITADGVAHPATKLVVDLGQEEVEPDNVAAVTKPKIILG